MEGATDSKPNQSSAVSDDGQMKKTAETTKFEETLAEETADSPSVTQSEDEESDHSGFKGDVSGNSSDDDSDETIDYNEWDYVEDPA